MRHLLLLAALLSGSFALASSSLAETALTRDDFVEACKLTPPNRDSNYPGPDHIVTYNNLALPAGKSNPAPGQSLYLTGRVFDERCVPLQGAKVEMWQADSSGHMRFPYPGAFANPYPLFAGSGEAITDNNGQFTFYTVFPGPLGPKRAPNIAFHVSHPNTRDLFTVMYFSGDSRNAGDPYFNRLPAPLQPLALGQVDADTVNTDSLHVHFDMTVSGSDGFRRF